MDGRRTGRGVSGQAAEANGQAKKGAMTRVAWVVLVGVVPLIVTAIVVGVALQFVGVPVWQTTLETLGVKQVAQTTTATETSLKADQSQIKQLKAQNAKLSQQTQSQSNQITQLQSQISSLQNQLTVQSNNYQEGQQEATILAQMDAQSAAQVLQKLGASEAGWVVAAMGPDASGPILQDVPTAFASDVLQQAAADKLLRSQQTANSTNSNSSTVGQ